MYLAAKPRKAIAEVPRLVISIRERQARFLIVSKCDPIGGRLLLPFILIYLCLRLRIIKEINSQLATGEDTSTALHRSPVRHCWTGS